MARTNTITLTADELNNIIAQAVATAMGTQKAQPKKGTKAPTKADMERKDGTVRKDGKVWWVSLDGEERKWVTQSSYDHICKKRAYASGEKTQRTDEEKDAYKVAYKAFYDKAWKKWQKSGKRTSEENKAEHKRIVAEFKAQYNK